RREREAGDDRLGATRVDGRRCPGPELHESVPESEITEHREGPGAGPLTVSARVNLPRRAPGGGPWLFPARGGREVDRPIGVGGVIPATLEPRPDDVRPGPAEEENRRHARASRQVQEASAIRLSGEVRIHHDPLPFEEPRLGPPRELVV